MAGMELRSSAFSDHDLIPRRYARDGENLSPALQWAGVPDGTAELLLLCEDPDAPSGTFLHWLVAGIDPGATGVGEGETPPAGASGPTASANGAGAGRSHRSVTTPPTGTSSASTPWTSRPGCRINQPSTACTAPSTRSPWPAAPRSAPTSGRRTRRL